MGISKESSKVGFRDIQTKKAFDKLKDTDPELFKHLSRAFNDILKNAFCGIQIPKKQFPKEYKGFSTLWKYNLPGAWRLLYTVKSPNKIEIVSVILDWMSHKDYERCSNINLGFFNTFNQFNCLS